MSSGRERQKSISRGSAWGRACRSPPPRMPLRYSPSHFHDRGLGPVRNRCSSVGDARVRRLSSASTRLRSPGWTGRDRAVDVRGEKLESLQSAFGAMGRMTRGDSAQPRPAVSKMAGLHGTRRARSFAEESASRVLARADRPLPISPLSRTRARRRSPRCGLRQPDMVAKVEDRPLEQGRIKVEIGKGRTPRSRSSHGRRWDAAARRGASLPSSARRP